MRLPLVFAVAASLVLCPVAHSQKRSRSTEPAAVVKVEPWNQFYTIDEYKNAARKAGTAVAVEGYIVMGAPSGGAFAFRLVDSVDKVLSGKDAEKLASVAVRCTVGASLVKRSPGLSWSKTGAQKITLYVGGSKAVKALHNEVDKIRVTGRAAAGKGVIDPVTQVEVMDANGDWKRLIR